MCLKRCHACRWLWRRCCCCWRRRRGKFDYEPADSGGVEKFFKLVLVGGRVGKTTLRCMFAKTSSPADALAAPVSGADPYSVREMDMGEETISLQICECTARDMKSQDSDGQITMPSLQLADGIFLVYDVTNRKTLTQLKEMMLSGEVLPHLCRAAHVLVVGTKSDLGDGERDIPTEEGKAFAERIGAGFVETSAMSGENVSKALWLMVASVVESVGGGKGKKKRRRGLKMPWSDTARLRKSLKKTPRRMFSAQALRLSLLAGVGQSTLSSEGSESTETQSGEGVERKGNSSKDESRSSMPSPISSVGSGEAFFAGGNEDSSSRDQYGSGRGVLV